MALPITGGCACGAIRYECAAEPVFACHCYCRDCQRASGSAFASLLVFARDAVSVTGAPRFHVTRSDRGGHPMRRGFCADCGSPVVLEEPHRPKILLVQAASLDDPSRHRPEASIFVSRAHDWAPIDPNLPRSPGMPPLPAGFGT